MTADHFSKDIQDFLECLSRHGVDYLLVGGEAVIYYGHPRLTGDIDVFYSPEENNAAHQEQGSRESSQGPGGSHIPSKSQTKQ